MMEFLYYLLLILAVFFWVLMIVDFFESRSRINRLKEQCGKLESTSRFYTYPQDQYVTITYGYVDDDNGCHLKVIKGGRK